MSDRNAVRLAWAGWAFLFLAASVAVMANPLRSVMPIYRYAALAWLDGRRIYELSGIGGFTYFPQATILLVPFAVLPGVLADIAWRLVSVGVFALSLRRVSHLFADGKGKDLFPLMTLVSVPVVWDCARNGQATLLMAAFMLLASADLCRSRWWRATLWLCLAVSIKPLAIVLLLLVTAVDRNMSWRLVLGVAATVLVPFLTQRPAYVVEQYAACIQNMTTAAHMGVVARGWTTPFTGLRAWDIDVPEKVQTVLRLVAALGTLGLSLFARRRFGRERSAVLVYALAALYVILFSPRTENNTYALLGPVAGYFVAEAALRKDHPGEAVLLGGLTLVMVGSRGIERMIAPAREQVWMSPLLATVLMMYVLVQVFAGIKRKGPGAGHDI